MHINYRADSSTPDRKRSALRSYRGIPWWGVIALYVVACGIGMALSAITKDIGIFFYIFFVACSLFGVLAAEFDALFTSIVMPVLAYTFSIPIFYLIQMSINDMTGTKTAILNIGIPFVRGVPVMLTGFVGAFIIGLVRIGAFGAKQGWDQLWIVSLFNKTQMAAGTKPAEPRKPAEKRRKAPTTAPTAPQPSNRRTATTPRPRPVGARPSTDIPRIAHPSRETPAPFGRYPGQQPSRATSDARGRQQPPTARRLTPEQMEDLRRRRRELALRVQRARAQQGGRMPPPQQGRRMPPPGGRIPPRQMPPSGGRRPYMDPRQAAARGRMGPDPRRQGMQGQRPMPPHARRPQRPSAEGERRQNPYAQTPPKYSRGRQDPRQPQNPYQRNPYLQGKEPRYRRRREDD
ncbi:MAG TPA: hypothetical protein GX530_01640 [Corynebacteriales bacterium]|nr:hypothetical protein [Mycobacteriales bacterium]